MTSIAYVALWIFVFAVPWENMIILPGIGTVSRLMGIVALGFALLAAVMSGRVRRPQVMHVAALLFVIWAGWGVYRAADQIRSISKFGTYCQLLLVLWMIWELAPNFRRQIGLLFAYVAGAYVSAINTILDYRSLGASSRRFTAEGFDPNDLGMTLVLALPMAWYLGMTSRHPVLRWACRGYLPVGLLAIGLTGSRGALVASIAALLIVPFTMTRLSPGKLIVAIVLLLGSGALVVTYIPEKVVQRLGSTTTEVEEGTLNGRLRIWKAGLEVLKEQPWIGQGTSGFNWAVSRRIGLGRDGQGRPAHNAYLNVLVEQGIIGFALYMLMFFAVLAKVLKLPSMERRFALVLLATAGVTMMPLNWDDRKPVWIILALLSALAETLATRTVRSQVVPQRSSPRPVPIARQPAAS